MTTMTLNETLKKLKALGNEAMRKQNTKWGAGDNQFGVKHGDIRALAKKIQSNPELAMPLWETGNVDAQLLAALLIKPRPCPPKRWIGWCGPSASRMWRTGSSPTSSSSTPTRRRFARNGWPPTIAGRHAPDGASPPS